MGIVKGGALRLFQTVLYAINFCCAAIILGIFGYFLSVLADRNLVISNNWKAVTGLSGVAVVYTIFAVILTCCLGGISFFAFLAIVLDVCFVGAMLAIAVLTRNGASSCRGIVTTPIGTGESTSHNGGFGDDVTYAVSLRTACRLETVCFAVAIIGAFFFLVTAAMQVALVRHHKKEKRYGPSPSNNYTSGYGKRKFWQRGGAPKGASKTRDAEMATAGGLAVPAAQHDVRPSHDTGYTGSTVAGAHTNAYDKVEPNGANHAGYHTQPTGTAVNPYGYDNTQPRYTTGTATNY